VRDDVGVGMPGEAGLTGPVQTGDPQRATVLERVDVEPEPDPRQNDRHRPRAVE
jgi:hypothetical protein